MVSFRKKVFKDFLQSLLWYTVGFFFATFVLVGAMLAKRMFSREQVTLLVVGLAFVYLALALVTAVVHLVYMWRMQGIASKLTDACAVDASLAYEWLRERSVSLQTYYALHNEFRDWLKLTQSPYR
jgi:uncharacterized membrane protein